MYVLVVRLGKIFSRPLFSATRTRPSGRKRTTAGLVSPEKTTDSEKPACLKVVAGAKTAAKSPAKRQRVSVAARRLWVGTDGNGEAPLGSTWSNL